MHTLNILSLNLNGLNSAVKRTRVLEYLHRKSISCALIQETHLKQSDVTRFQNKYYKLIAFSCTQNKTKGVLILVNRKLNLTIEHLGSDEKGRFVFIRCKIYNNRLALVSIYGPNETDSAFLTQISKTLLEEIDCPLVVGGDFNAVINPALDKSQSDTTANPSSKLLNKFITELNLIDLWRIQNTKAKDFTFFSNRHKTFSRIDYIFLSPSLISSNSSISILPIHFGVPWSSSISSHPMRDWIAPSAGRPSVSLIYNKIIDCITKPLSIKTIWYRELSDLNLSVDWERVWFNLSLTSNNLAHRLIHFKVIHRAYITPYKRFKMKLQSNLNCHICNTTSSGTFLHMFWECPLVISLWTHVNLVLSSLLRIDWFVNPSLCLLKDDSGLCISSMQKRMLFAGFTAVKKTIIQNLFTPHMYRKTYWICSLLQIVSCECTTARVGGARPSTIDAWQCFLLDIRDCIKE